MHHNGPFSIPAINDYVPEKLKPYIIILFVIVFQFSGGIYLAAANEMVGTTGLLQEDILMAGFASLAGMALVFAYMLRLKMRFTSKFSLLLCSVVLILCNIICLHTDNVVVLVSACFIAGIFRMWATFECNSTIQLWLTPKRDLSIFFCYIYLLVQGSILLSGIPNMYMAYFANWKYMHWLIIGALLMVVLATLLIFNSKRFMKPFPLFGIDWLGGFMWGLILLCINFICVYGEHYDWWYSKEIRVAGIFLLVLLVLNIYRASFIRHPFISLQTFKYKAVYVPLFLYLVVDIFLAPAHLIEHIYFEKILQYDAMHLIYVNLTGFSGVVVGSIFGFYFFARKKHSYKATFLIGFGAIMIYLFIMYFVIDYRTSSAMLIAPVFFRNFGYVILAIVLITNLVKVPFHHFFQAVSVQAFVSAACGSAIGSAVLHHMFSSIATKNFQLSSANFDRINHQLQRIDQGHFLPLFENQVLLVSFKEVYGYLLILCIGCFVSFVFYRYPYFPVQTLYPRMRAIRRMLKKEVTDLQ